MKRLCAAASLLLLLAPRESIGQAGLLVPTSSGRPDPAVLSLREMTIDVGIARGYARVNVRQVFENHTDRIQEGNYRFRLPPSAAVGDFAVWDGLVRIPGVILEKQRARSIYRELTAQRIDPGLLQQGEEEGGLEGPADRPSGGALFSVHVAPIPPYATKRLELQFQQEVPVIEGQGEFRLGLRPPDGEPPVAATLGIRVRLDGEAGSEQKPAKGDLPLKREGDELVFSGNDVALDRDLVVRLRPRGAAPLRVTAFRNPDGALPDGLALAPWERPAEIPPEKDGFFLLELSPPMKAAPAPDTTKAAPAATRPPVTLAILFDTSLGHRWSGLETAYGYLLRVLEAMGPEDRFVLVPFDRAPAEDAELQPATAAARQAALEKLRARLLRPGSDVPKALTAGRKLVGKGGRLLLLTDGPSGVSAQALTSGASGLPLFVALTGEETREAYRVAATGVLIPGTTDLEANLFFKRVLGPVEKPKPEKTSKVTDEAPFTVTGGEPGLRDIYPVMVQPAAPGSLSGWIGRYANPQPELQWAVSTTLLPAESKVLSAPLPERALDARDLPRRWARARVDYLLARIEAEGEKREWIEEIIALSKRYKFVTPYTAFLAAPRSLLRPRRIQPGDPVLRVECDPGIVSATALFPFGLRLPLVRRPASNLWEGRFLVPEGLKDGRYTVRVLLRDKGGARLSESKAFVLDGRSPSVRPEIPARARAGEPLRVAVRTDEDVILLSARLGEGAPVPLRWDDAAKRSVGTIPLPVSLRGPQEIVFEAVDAAKNHGFARATVEVMP